MSAPSARPGWTRLWPVALLLGALGLAYALELPALLSFEALAAHRATLLGFVAGAPRLAGLAYVLVYIAVVAFSLPGGAVMTLAGGFLFGPWSGAALTVVGATLGACLLHLLARHALGGLLDRARTPALAALRQGLAEDGFWYLLSLRLVPVVPFWLANLAPSVVGMRLAPYALATFLGIIPATIVFSGIGAGLGQVFAAGGRPDLSAILAPGVLLPLLGLALLSLGGAWWRARTRRRAVDARGGGTHG
jgi:uncharacterized membrane protein YdjX (TVP38/TMEM64 family)